MSDNIQVSIRVRPLNTRETLDTQAGRCVQIHEHCNSISIQVNSMLKTFNFDYVADEDTNQETIFFKVAKPITENCLKGYNGTVFSYGQTGSGKTHTIIGHYSSSFNDQQAGILPKCLEFILEKTSSEMNSRENLEYLVKCSFLEIYNEQIKDLLSEDSRSLQIREDIKKGCYVEDLIEESVFNIDSAFQCLTRGLQRRHVGSTLMNNKSSRSHSVFSVRVEAKENKHEVLTYRNSVFHIIDLAGSERQKLAGTSGERLREAAMINKSLLTLGDVINSLVEIAEGKSRYVRYRDSRLTFLLKDSIGGNSKTSIIANISPSFISYFETLSTLNFAERAKLVKNRAVINEDTLETLNNLKAENQRLRNLLQNNPEALLMTPRVRDLQEIIAKTTQLRLESESFLQQIIETKESYIEELLKNIEKYEEKLRRERMINKFKEEHLRALKKGERIAENQVISELRQEILALQKENLNHPVAAKYFVENDLLKYRIASLVNELNEAPESMMRRFKENQELTERIAHQFSENLQYQKNLELKMENIKYRNEELEKNLDAAEEHKNQLVFELETLKAKLSAVDDPAQQEESRKTPLKPLDPNIRQGRSSRSSLNGYPLFLSSFSPSFIPISAQKNHQGRSEYETQPMVGIQECVECQSKDLKISDLEKRVNSLTPLYIQQEAMLEENFNLYQDIKKMNHELNQKELTIIEMGEENHNLHAENEMFSAKIKEFTYEINEKSRIIHEFSNNKQIFIYEQQDFNKLTDLNSNLIDENSRLKTENAKISKNFLELLKNQEQTILNLRKTQDNEFSLQKEVDELRGKLKEMQRENKSLSERLAETTQELVRTNGHRNHNQKINYLSKLKEDYNSLKSQNSKHKDEIRMLCEKIDLITKKYEQLAKANGNKDYIEALEAEKQKVKDLELNLDEFQEVFCEVRNILSLLPFINEFSSLRIDLVIKQVLEHYNLEISKHEEEILNLHKEMNKLESIRAFLENENEFLKQKMFCMKT